MSRFSIRNPYFIIVTCSGLGDDRGCQPGADAGGPVSNAVYLLVYGRKHRNA